MTGRYEKLMSRVRSGERVMIDGGTGSEMERRGISRVTNGWTGGSALSHPNTVRAVHVDYIGTGANVIISNTFATHKSVLRDVGVEANFEALNRRSVELAVEARDAAGRPDVVVGGGMSHWSWTGDNPSLDQLEADATEQATIMAQAGAEVLVLEMMINIDRMLRLMAAARSTGLPVWVGFTVGTEDGKLHTPGAMTLRDGELLADAIAALDGFDVDLITIMHTDVALIDPCLDVMFEKWSGPIGVYAHSASESDGEIRFDDVISPADYAARCQGWIERGVNVIGGCCGTRPDHMHEIAKLETVT